MSRSQRYLSYLLRLWPTRDGAQQIWRGSLENPLSGERQGFASLDELLDYLRREMDAQTNDDCVGQSRDARSCVSTRKPGEILEWEDK